MPEGLRDDPRIPLIAAVLAIGETPDGLMLCERFLQEAAKLQSGRSRVTAAQFRDVISPEMAMAIKGVAEGLAIAADHAELLAERAGPFTRTPPRPEPVQD